MATSITVYANAGDGWMYAGTDAHFSNARDAANGNRKITDTTEIDLGLDTDFESYKYVVMRGYLHFDTSSIPANATIISATLSLFLTGAFDIIPTGFDVFLQKDTDEIYPHNPLEYGDFDRTLYAGGGASKIAVIDGASGYRVFIFNSVGRSTWINKDGTSKFCLRSSLDVSPTLPGAKMVAAFYTSEKGGSFRPKLDITYGTKPTVTTDAASGLGSTYATGNGTVDATGDSAITEYGVIWNDDGSDPVDIVSADHKSTGSDLAGGTFTAAITGLSASTSYYYRAYATNGAGTSYGSAVQFTTSAPAAEFTVTTQDATAITDTTATCHGTIVEDQGYSITQHGVVYKKGGDPGTPSDPTTAEGYTQKGAGAEGAFTSDIVGLDANSLYYVRAYAQTTDDGGHIAYGDLILFYTKKALATLTVYALAGDGYLGLTDLDAGGTCTSVGTAVRDATDASVINTTMTSYVVKSSCSVYGAGVIVEMRRIFMFFDTSSIPAGATLGTATLSLYIFSGTGGVRIKDGQPTYPTESAGSPALQKSDWQLSHYPITAGSSPGVLTPDQYNDIVLSTTSINITGLTKFMVKLLDEVHSTPPDWAIITAIYSAEKAGTDFDPKLVVTYYPEADKPISPQINIGDSRKDIEYMLINIGGVWKDVPVTQINVGDAWKDLAA